MTPLLLKTGCGEKASRESAILIVLTIERGDVGMGTVILGLLFPDFFTAIGIGGILL